MSQVRKSILLSFGQNYFRFALQFAASVIIARLLSPAEIGIFSVAMVLIGFAQRFRDFGVANYIIQERELSREKIRAAFAMTLITAWTLAAAIALASGLAADFYHEPGVKSVMLVLALNFVLLPFGTIPIAYLQRQMDFEHIALINILSSVLSTATGIGLAYLGFSSLALAWGSVAGIVGNILFAAIWRPRDLPFLPGLKGIGEVFSFGTLSSFVLMLSDLSEGAADLILGRLSGMAAVGFFGRATGLVSMFDRFVMSALFSVALPHFAEQSRQSGAAGKIFLRSMTYATALAWPFFACLAILAHPVILLLYGEKWAPSVPVLQLLCIAMFALSPFLLMSSMMTAIGQMRQSLYLLAVNVPLRVLFVWLATPYGVEAVAATFIASSLIDVSIYIVQCRLVLSVRPGEMIDALRESAGVAIFTALPPLLLFGGTSPGASWIALASGLASCVAGWLAGIYLFRHPLRSEINNLLIVIRKTVGAPR